MRRRTKILLISVAVAAGIVGWMAVAGTRLAARFEPYVKDQATAYLSRRFQSEVEIGALRIDSPRIAPLRLFLSKGRGMVGKVTAENVILRHKGRRDIPPLFSIRRVRFEVDLGRMFDPQKRVALAHVEDMKIVVPPRGERPSLQPASGVGLTSESPLSWALPSPPDAKDVLVEQVSIVGSSLLILPRNKSRKPLEFALRRVTLNSVQLRNELEYEAELTNPKPPGVVRARGQFGPWNADSPGDTPLAGQYRFSGADLGVFRAIAGILESDGKFKGTLSEVQAAGVVTVPDFRLRDGGQALPLTASFEALVDGTNGNTELRPVRARLLNTWFTTSGTVIKHDRDTRRRIELQVSMPDGNLEDLLRLAIRQPPPLAGKIAMQARILVPPLAGKVVEKLEIDGRFTLARGLFQQPKVQDKVDELSRRAQAQPGNTAIDNVFSRLAAVFRLEDQQLHFTSLTFDVPGAQVALAGKFNLEADALDMRGTLRMDAKASQTQTGWKRWVLKPVDPFFSREGAGTLLRIHVSGSSKEPKFGASR